MMKFIKHKIKSSFINKVCRFVRLGCRASLAMTAVLLGVSFIFSLTACDGKKDDVVNGKPVVKIGMGLPLTGDYDHIGKSVKNAVTMAFEKWEDKDTKYKYELIFEDDGLLSRGAVNVSNKFLNLDNVNALLVFWGQTGKIYTSHADERQKVMLACAALNDMADPKFVLNNYTQYEEMTDVLINKLKKEGVKTVVYTADTHAVGVAQSIFFKEALEKAGIKVLAIERYHKGTVDFRLSIAKLEKLQPDYYITAIEQPGTVNFIKQHREITKKNNLAGIDVFPFMPKEYWALANDLWYIQAAGGTQDFRNRYEDKYKGTLENCAANSYDNLDLLIYAYENTSLREGFLIPNNEDVVKTLQNIKEWNGAMGQVTIDSEGVIRSKPDLYIMKNAEPFLLEK
ncbi:MAG: ABC transporter substrate-binding protein [Alphaproteobacteria bacterium]